MKKIKYAILKNGDYETINRRISNITYFDFQTKGEKAKKNVVRILKECYIDVKEVSKVVLLDGTLETEVEMY